ncbi:MAG: hypothetical protein MZU97_06515 [Bacillus subtilis]|nr:hypothetical protein [Bacillus subtilis]
MRRLVLGLFLFLLAATFVGCGESVTTLPEDITTGVPPPATSTTAESRHPRDNDSLIDEIAEKIKDAFE